MKQTLTMLSLTIATASAHPGHPGHEDWPFGDISWTMVLSGLAIAFILTVAVRRLGKRIGLKPMPSSRS